MKKSASSARGSIHGHQNFYLTERSAITRCRNFNASKICKITAVELKLASFLYLCSYVGRDYAPSFQSWNFTKRQRTRGEIVAFLVSWSTMFANAAVHSENEYNLPSRSFEKKKKTLLFFQDVFFFNLCSRLSCEGCVTWNRNNWLFFKRNGQHDPGPTPIFPNSLIFAFHLAFNQSTDVVSLWWPTNCKVSLFVLTDLSNGTRTFLNMR